MSVICIEKVCFTQVLFWPRTFLSMLNFCFGFLEMYLLGSEFVLLVREMKMKTLFTNCIPLLLTFLLLHSRVSLSLFYNTLHWNYGQYVVNMTTSVADQNEAGRAEKMFLRPPSLPSPPISGSRWPPVPLYLTVWIRHWHSYGFNCKSTPSFKDLVVQLHLWWPTVWSEVNRRSTGLSLRARGQEFPQLL